jgi:16S rRNA (cytosine1402-N4)-methyltransferase
MSAKANHSQMVQHVPVLLNEVIGALQPHDDGVYVDGTFGAGGYARAMLERADCRVLAIDRDRDAVAAGAAMVAAYNGRLMLAHGRYAAMADHLSEQGIDRVDGVALDLGVSSMQIDQPARGFSFSTDGPLDMRMDQSGPSAADVVNHFKQAEIADILFRLGEERRARAIARAIVQHRSDRPFARTRELADLVSAIVGPKGGKRKIHPATRSFLALRLYVNGELPELAQGLAAAERVLRPGGRLAVVTFHSLEDRIVKRFFRQRQVPPARPSRHLPETPDDAPAPSFKRIAGGEATPSADETAVNPRARSARLRAGERTDAPALALDMAALGVPAIAMKEPVT